MAYTFQYVPTSGDLSGVSFESQTEIAINELGVHTEAAEYAANQAIATAQNAQTTANDALLTAQNADGSAGNARLTADQAIAAAGNAQTDAAVALERANNAYDTAEIARTTAGSALAGAQTATETANNAQAEAATASQNAEQAVAMAQGALAAASIDNGLFTVDATLRDADEAYRGTEKSYLTSTDEDGPNVNFPDALAFPAYFEVLMSDEGGAVMQRCWQDGGTRVFTRFASVDDSDPDNPVVAWTAWNSLAMPDVLHEAKVVVNPEGQPEGTYLVLTFSTDQGPEAVYVNVSQLVDLYTPGNKAITISPDNKISLALANDSGLVINEGGLALCFATDAELTAKNTTMPPSAAQVAGIHHRLAALESNAGEGIKIATPQSVGVIKPGAGLAVAADGTLTLGALPSSFPTGGIIMWSGSVASIPVGWALCTGANGTPNLLDRFVVGAGSGYAVGAVGGAASHLHGVGVGDTTLAEWQMPWHTHAISRSDSNKGNATSLVSAGMEGPADRYTGYTGSSGAHNHTAWSDARDHRPPYYALAYIMKL